MIAALNRGSELLLAVTLIASAPDQLVPQTSAGSSAQDTSAVIDTLRSVSDTLGAEAVDRVPVVVGGDTLFYIAERIGPFPPVARVRAIESRFRSLTRDPVRQPGEISVFHGEKTSDLLIGDLVIMTVTDGDAAAVGLTRQEAAERYARIVDEALHEQAIATNWRAILMGVGLTALATVILVYLLRFLQRFFRRVYPTIRERGPERLPSLRIQKLELVPKSQIVETLLLAAKATRVLITIALLYFYVPLVLSFFPWTRELASHWLDYVLTPIDVVTSAIVSYLPNLLFIAVIILATRYLLRLVRLVFLGMEHERIHFRGFHPEWAEPTYKLARIFIIALAVIVTIPYLPQSESTAFKGVGAFLALLISLGSASAVANLMAGTVMVYMRPFKLGDRVKIADTVGDVIEKTLLVTRVRTNKNEEISIPNALVLGSHLVNYSNSAREGKLILHTMVTIGYDVDWRRVHEALLSAATDLEAIQEDPAPFVLQKSLDDYSVAYELNAYTDDAKRMARTYSELHQNIQDRCAEAGIEILSPLYAATRDGNRSTIPKAGTKSKKVGA